MTEDLTGIQTWASDAENQSRDALTRKLLNSTLPKDQLLSNIGLFIESKNLSRILFMDHIYRQIVDVQGCIVEFGCRWGQNLALYEALRGIYEPFNRHRKIIGFDTFEGFPSLDEKDGAANLMVKGNLATTENYQEELEGILDVHEQLNPLDHIKKYELRKGDGTKEFPKYLDENPHTVVALAYFDFDLYEPTKECLEALRPRLTKGSVVGFDEVNDPDSPGETVALMEVLGLQNIRLKRFPHASRVSYFVVE
ncbi:TylF/MycF/NovP-related O-methyltransferase [Terasakiella sp. A23]|uniref:TylF/MycF/NovP-related O-methyltransferase n=1 Tax=Terasakiella sp. FCG-A23 TaxID=3080561 RepID=UPI002954ED61|nr:TylF/MycF/NovP-related O-methyltransferase [Terasakiella sp. A23]MDV7339027.1 TylF/MycF/NovP-related O-methyltransferase [Terasakiella sp. A23]